jgi:hypothetical protein
MVIGQVQKYWTLLVVIYNQQFDVYQVLIDLIHP